MKKKSKVAFASALTMLALTPAAVTAVEPSVATTGFYTDDSFTSPVQYKNLTLQQKRNLLAKEDLVFVVNGFVYFAKDALGKSDAELSRIAITEAVFESQYGELTTSGYGQVAENFEVLSID